MAARHQRLYTFAEVQGDFCEAETPHLDRIADAGGLVLVADVATTPEELPPAPRLQCDARAAFFDGGGRCCGVVQLSVLRRYRHGVPLDMHDFLALLDDVLGWPPFGTGYAAEHRDMVLAVYEAVYGL